jgi:hypothetical protein
VLEQLPHGDAASVVAVPVDHPGQQLLDGRVEGQTALADELQDSRSDEGLGEAADAESRVPGNRGAARSGLP